MKTVWNDWLKQAVFIYSVLYTIATIFNSVLYLLNGHYEILMEIGMNWTGLLSSLLLF